MGGIFLKRFYIPHVSKSGNRSPPAQPNLDTNMMYHTVKRKGNALKSKCDVQ